MEYQRLGEHIREVNVRNRDLAVTKPMGINIDKYFMPSVANVIGTDLSTYKFVSKNQFACNLMHVGRDEKIPMAMHTSDNPIIVSPAYFVFEIKKTEVLLPEYLMMWFSRPEFDRNAWFFTDSDVRGGMSKAALLDMQLPVPPIERQREIVAEYQTLTDRINLNQQMIQKLEATAQALYQKTFVTNIDKENLPPGWRMGTLGEICNCFSGYPFDSENYSESNGIIALRGENVTEQSLRWNTIKKYCGEITNQIDKCRLQEWDIVIGMDGSKVGKNWSFINQYDLPLLLAQRVACLRSGALEKQFYTYMALKMEGFSDYVSRVNTGSTILHISLLQIEEFPIPIPSKEQLKMINEQWIPILERICLNKHQNEKLTELQSLLLAKMGQ